MKEETNNEMDLLLRRLGRRDDFSVSDAAGSHLDADELSAYAENALPAAARGRYTTHLADCSQCRQLVVQLSSAAGVVAVSETTKATKPLGWKTFLASLFTPMVLRYAAPALGLIVVSVIGFVILRRQNSPQFVTQVTNNEQQRPVQSAKAEPSVSGQTEDKNSRGLVDQPEKKQPSQTVPAPAPNAPPAVSSVEAEVSKEKAAGQPNVEQRPVTANEPPPPKLEASATPAESQKTADTEERKRDARDLPASAPAAAKELRFEGQREDKDNFARAANRKSKPADKVSATQGVGSIGEVDSLSSNTRTVAGRRFQKKGGVWIDTAYDSSKDSMTVARGSEQYRTLVADEPAIKTIADELGGEIIVVWKGHTYRIR